MILHEMGKGDPKTKLMPYRLSPIQKEVASHYDSNMLLILSWTSFLAAIAISRLQTSREVQERGTNIH